MKTLKQEEVDGTRIVTWRTHGGGSAVSSSRSTTAKGLHSALAYRPPAEFEAGLARPAIYPPCYSQAAQATVNATSS